jgi:hypothetical protein
MPRTRFWAVGTGFCAVKVKLTMRPGSAEDCQCPRTPTFGGLSAGRSRQLADAKFPVCGDPALAQHGQAAYWGAIACVSCPL